MLPAARTSPAASLRLCSVQSGRSFVPTRGLRPGSCAAVSSCVFRAQPRRLSCIMPAVAHRCCASLRLQAPCSHMPFHACSELAYPVLIVCMG